MKTAVFSVYYKEARVHMDRFLTTIANQTDQDFDLVILNDSDEDIDELENAIVLNKRLSIAKNREFGINWIKSNGYEALIFLDIDDTMSKDRVSIAKSHLEVNDIFVNQLKYKKKSLFFSNSYNLDNYNFCGFSNSAIRVDKIDKVELFDDLVAVDWYFFSYLENLGKSIEFNISTNSYYNIHESNIAGLQRDIKKAINVKAKHYKYLSKSFIKFKEYSDFFNMLIKDDDLLRDYIKNVEKTIYKRFYWWQEAPYMKDFCADNR